MNQEMTERIAETKELVITAEWREKILACQESGKPVTAWCEENGISPSTYYRKLRMMREDILSGDAADRTDQTESPARDQNHSGRDQYSHAGECGSGAVGGDRRGVEVMLSDLLAMSQPYLVTGYTDLRRGIDGLAGAPRRADETRIGERKARGEEMERFIRQVEERDGVVGEFDAVMWAALVREVTVGEDGMVFKLNDETDISV